MNKVLFPFLFAACLLTSACSNDEPQIPANAITVNMMNDDNKQSTIGSSDVYISSANNFTSQTCGIVKLGGKASMNQNPNLSQIAQEVAVLPGNYYQILSAGLIKKVAEESAYPLDASYYNMYVDSWIYNNDKEIAGAVISYTECFPHSKSLPEWDTEIEVNLHEKNGVETAAYSSAKGVRIDETYYCTGVNANGLADHIEIVISGNKISFKNSGWCPGDQATITLLIRCESIYSRVKLIVNSAN